MLHKQALTADRDMAEATNVSGDWCQGMYSCSESVPDPHRRALTADREMAEATGVERRLGWYAAGQHIALDVARGLHFLHKSGVRRRHSPCALAPGSRPPRMQLVVSKCPAVAMTKQHIPSLPALRFRLQPSAGAAGSLCAVALVPAFSPPSFLPRLLCAQ